jgi:hypothetical protein
MKRAQVSLGWTFVKDKSQEFGPRSVKGGAVFVFASQCKCPADSVGENSGRQVALI